MKAMIYREFGPPEVLISLARCRQTTQTQVPIALLLAK
jgi:hypothetical protein